MKRIKARCFAEAFEINERELFSLVGGGGKTTLLYMLADELSGGEALVATATTTKMFVPQDDDPVQLICRGDYDALALSLDDLDGVVPLFGSSVIEGGKFEGITPDQCDALFDDGVIDYLIVEADGARRKPVKAPGSSEPVVPGATTLFIAVIGLTALGKPLGEEVAFRPELVAKAAGVKEGDIITDKVLTSLPLSEKGLMKGCPPTARMVLMLNQADTDTHKIAARKIAASVLDIDSPWERVVIAHLEGEEPIAEVWRR